MKKIFTLVCAVLGMSATMMAELPYTYTPVETVEITGSGVESSGTDNYKVLVSSELLGDAMIDVVGANTMMVTILGTSNINNWGTIRLTTDETGEDYVGYTGNGSDGAYEYGEGITTNLIYELDEALTEQSEFALYGEGGGWTASDVLATLVSVTFYKTENYILDMSNQWNYTTTFSGKMKVTFTGSDDDEYALKTHTAGGTFTLYLGEATTANINVTVYEVSVSEGASITVGTTTVTGATTVEISSGVTSVAITGTADGDYIIFDATLDGEPFNYAVGKYPTDYSIVSYNTAPTVQYDGQYGGQDLLNAETLEPVTFDPENDDPITFTIEVAEAFKGTMLVELQNGGNGFAWLTFSDSFSFTLDGSTTNVVDNIAIKANDEADTGNNNAPYPFTVSYLSITSKPYMESSSNSIKEIESADAEAVEVARYNVAGQKISGEQKGINIVVYSDGSSKKVLVK